MASDKITIALCSAAVGFALAWCIRGRLTKRIIRSPSKITIKEKSNLRPSEECKLTLVVRNDLHMGKGKIAAQCSHASVMAYETIQENDPKMLALWRNYGQTKVALRCDNEYTLLDLQREAKAKGLAANIVRDAGRTQIVSGTKTVLAVGPGPATLVDSVTGHLKLL